MRTLAASFVALATLVISPMLHAQQTAFAIVPARVDLAMDRAPSPAGLGPAYAVRDDSPDRRAWKRSLIGVAASQSLDIASSYGMRELNPMLASSDGSFGGKAASIKIGATGAVIALEYVLLKKYPRTAGIFSKLNWASSVLTTSFAIHNYAIR